MSTVRVVNRFVRQRTWPEHHDWITVAVYLDGRIVANLTRYERRKPFVLDVSPGHHSFEVRAAPKVLLTTEARVAAGRTVDLEVYEPRWKPFRGFGPAALAVTTR